MKKSILALGLLSIGYTQTNFGMFARNFGRKYFLQQQRSVYSKPHETQAEKSRKAIEELLLKKQLERIETELKEVKKTTQFISGAVAIFGGVLLIEDTRKLFWNHS